MYMSHIYAKNDPRGPKRSQEETRGAIYMYMSHIYAKEEPRGAIYMYMSHIYAKEEPRRAKRSQEETRGAVYMYMSHIYAKKKRSIHSYREPIGEREAFSYARRSLEDTTKPRGAYQELIESHREQHTKLSGA